MGNWLAGPPAIPWPSVNTGWRKNPGVLEWVTTAQRNGLFKVHFMQLYP